MPPDGVIPELPYAGVAGAAAWLCRAFGFSERVESAPQINAYFIAAMNLSWHCIDAA